MITNSAHIHIDQRYSYDKDSLSGHWLLRQAVKRVTYSLSNVLGARAPPNSLMCSCLQSLTKKTIAWIASPLKLCDLVG